MMLYMHDSTVFIISTDRLLEGDCSNHITYLYSLSVCLCLCLIHFSLDSVSTAIAVVNRTKNLWFQPSMTKTQAADMLSSSKPRSFVVRESQKEPGAYAVTARAPEDLIRRSQNPPIPPGPYRYLSFYCL